MYNKYYNLYPKVMFKYTTYDKLNLYFIVLFTQKHILGTL